MTDPTTSPERAPRLAELLSWHWTNQLRPGVGTWDHAGSAPAQLDDGYARGVAGVRLPGAEGPERPVGPGEGEWAASPSAEMVLHIDREAIHHGAGTLVLRDLRRHGAAAR